MPAARRAGRYAAVTVDAVSTMTVAAIVHGSPGANPKSYAEKTRITATAAGMPTRIPAVTSTSDSRTIFHSTAPGDAPTAIRTPISRRRRATANVSTPYTPMTATTSASAPNAPETRATSRSVGSRWPAGRREG